jgi:hypothetical protein
MQNYTHSADVVANAYTFMIKRAVHLMKTQESVSQATGVSERTVK